MKLTAWEVLRAGSLSPVMNGDAMSRAARLGISNNGMTCVRFLVEEERALIEVKIVLDAPGKTPDEAVEMARAMLAGRRIDIG